MKEKPISLPHPFKHIVLPMLHIISRVAPETPIYFIQTGFHFPETLQFRDEVGRRFGLNIMNIESQRSKDSATK